MTPHLEGIVVPLLTPFRADNGDLDEAALRRLVDRLIPTGVQGLIVNAATSEFFHLDEAERRRAAEIVVEQAAGRIPVLAGCGAPGTRLSIAAARHAQSIGAVGLLMMPPYYVPLSVDHGFIVSCTGPDQCACAVAWVDAYNASGVLVSHTRWLAPRCWRVP